MNEVLWCSSWNELGMLYQKSGHLGIILRCCQVRNHSVPASVRLVQHSWSCCCQTQLQCSACPSCCCLQQRSDPVLQDISPEDISHGLCSFPLWICLWGIVVIQRNVWSCEKLSCWKSSLVLSHTCPYIHSQLYKRHSSTSESPTVWLCWSSFSASFFFFYLNHSWSHLRAD